MRSNDKLSSGGRTVSLEIPRKKRRGRRLLRRIVRRMPCPTTNPKSRHTGPGCLGRLAIDFREDSIQVLLGERLVQCDQQPRKNESPERHHSPKDGYSPAV